jgi:tetratricopeptide (TPR) repeat protein
MTQPPDPQPTTAPPPTVEDGLATGPHLDPEGARTFQPAGTVPHKDAAPELPGYTIEGVLGRGGMGVVYKARHLALKRTVALKMMLGGGHAGAQERARFKAEAEAVARLQHPNVVQIHEVGEHEGQPFCALELVEGGSLAQKLGGKSLPAREAARLVEALAQAMHLAHSRNIVHRDLKPANVLLTPEGQPKVSDFGLARQLDTDSGQTQAGQVMGTPSYMAPEQAAGQAHAAGPAADVYALGAILYECLTGRPPFKGASTLQTLEQVRSQEPAAPRSLSPKVPRDLETVCLKCLRKEPERRYASAAALGEDLRRWQAGEPIQARRVGRVERGVKWARRNPAVAALLVLVVLAVLGGGAGIYLKYLDAQEQAGIARAKTKVAEEKEELAEQRRKEAEEALKDKDKALERAQEQLAANALIMARAAWEKGNAAAAQGHLDAVPEKPTLRNFEWRYLRRQYEGGLFSLRGHTGYVSGVAFSPDGTRIATASDGRTARLWDARTGALVLELKGHGSSVSGVAFSPDGTRIATASGDRTRLWDARTKQADAVEIGYRAWATRPAPDWHAAVANHLDRTGERFAAAFHLRRLLDLAPSHVVVLLRGRPFSAAGDSGPLALAAYDAAIAREPDNAALRLRRALVRSRLGRHQQARADLDRVAALAREGPAVPLARSLLEARAGRAAQARSAREQAMRQTAVLPALDAQRNWEGRRRPQPPPRGPAADAADTVLAVEEELDVERRAGPLQAARAVMAGGDRVGPFSAAQALALDLRQPTLSAQDAATAWRLCGLARCAHGDWRRAVADLGAALELAPADLTARRARARANAETGQWSRTVIDCTACLKEQPDGWELWYLRGLAHRQLKKQDLALADLTEALARGGGLAVRWERAASAFALKKWDLAAADYGEVAKRSPKDARIQLHLGIALYNQGKREEAVEPLRRAVALEPENALYQHWLGSVLNARGKYAEASAALRRAAKLAPTDATIHHNLGYALHGLGRLDEALKSYRRSLDLTAPNDPARPARQQVVAETERLLPLAARLPAFLSGKAKPTSAAEALDLARLCRSTKRHAASARFYAEAFAVQPGLADDLKARHRYNAACYAALAGSGKGEDGKLDEKEKARWRRQALTWLRADLALRVKQLASGKAADRQEVAAKMRHWEQDSDLAGVRDPAAVARLPADEQEAWKKLWADVAALLQKAQPRPKQPARSGAGVRKEGRSDSFKEGGR